jgi:mono/diheme cytochrome c family protein
MPHRPLSAALMPAAAALLLAAPWHASAAPPAPAFTAVWTPGFAAARNQPRPPTAAMPVPAGFTRAQLELGDRIFHGEAAEGTCAFCHGTDARGTGAGNDLSTGMFLWSDGSVKQLARTIRHNMATVPGQDGKLTNEDVVAVSVYLWGLDHEPLSQRLALSR